MSWLVGRSRQASTPLSKGALRRWEEGVGIAGFHCGNARGASSSSLSYKTASSLKPMPQNSDSVPGFDADSPNEHLCISLSLSEGGL